MRQSKRVGFHAAGLAFAMSLTQACASSAPQLPEETFNACVADLRDAGAQRGISPDTLEVAFGEMRQQPRVIALDRSQPEFTQTFGQYMEARVTPYRIQRGRELYAEHEELLAEVASDFEVPARYLVAFWGLETNYGRTFGNMPVLDSLATLACEGRRADFFTDELMHALDILEENRIERRRMEGSWAGAMGHTQFMPSTYTRYAVDYDGDGRVDLWGSLPDAMASSANFLRHLGWNPAERWGREVSLPADFDWHLSGLQESRTVNEWAELGVRRADGSPLPDAELEASLLLPAGHQGPAFLVYPNFRVIMRWNPSVYYALAVGHLADRIVGYGGLVAGLPTDEKALRREEVKEIQEHLNALGYDAGPVDGVAGSQTRQAASAFQRERGAPADGHADHALLEKLRAANGKEGG